MMQLGNVSTPKVKDSKSERFEFNDETNTKLNPVNYGRKTDIWSLGITLVEMTLAKPPFRNTAAAIYCVCMKKQYPSFPDTMSYYAKGFLSR
jgi:serine/threonine protein kinase